MAPELVTERQISVLPHDNGKKLGLGLRKKQIVTIEGLEKPFLLKEYGAGNLIRTQKGALTGEVTEKPVTLLGVEYQVSRPFVCDLLAQNIASLIPDGSHNITQLLVRYDDGRMATASEFVKNAHTLLNSKVFDIGSAVKASAMTMLLMDGDMAKPSNYLVNPDNNVVVVVDYDAAPYVAEVMSHESFTNEVVQKKIMDELATTTLLRALILKRLTKDKYDIMSVIEEVEQYREKVLANGSAILNQSLKDTVSAIDLLIPDSQPNKRAACKKLLNICKELYVKYHIKGALPLVIKRVRDVEVMRQADGELLDKDAQHELLLSDNYLSLAKHRGYTVVQDNETVSIEQYMSTQDLAFSELDDCDAITPNDVLHNLEIAVAGVRFIEDPSLINSLRCKFAPYNYLQCSIGLMVCLILLPIALLLSLILLPCTVSGYIAAKRNLDASASAEEDFVKEWPGKDLDGPVSTRNDRRTVTSTKSTLAEKASSQESANERLHEYPGKLSDAALGLECANSPRCGIS